MCCDHLVCASCAGPVAAGGCSVCRGARAQLHGSTPIPYAALVGVLAAFLTLALALRLIAG
jgi:hypothetical protein